jgi:hypothetical protein
MWKKDSSTELNMNCPKCGFQKDEGQECCLRCGVIFARYRPATETRRPPIEIQPGHVQPKPGLFRRFYRIFRWISLSILIVAVLLILRTSRSPQIEITPEATQSAETKIQEFQNSMEHGAGQKLEMDESELNGWLQKNLALKKTEGSGVAETQTSDSIVDRAKTAASGSPTEKEALEQARSSVRDVKIELLEDSIRIYALFDMHGMELSLELEGKPVVQGGYLKLEPASGKLGSMPLTAGTLRSATDRVFSSPENKEKFKLSPNIRDIRIEDGRLVLIPR